VNTHLDKWASVLIVTIVIGASLIAACALLAKKWKQRAHGTPTAQGERHSSGFSTPESLRSYLTDAFESGGEPRFREACRTVARDQGCTDEQVQIQFFELLLKNRRRNSARKVRP
jgi:hypothetical protein